MIFESFQNKYAMKRSFDGVKVIVSRGFQANFFWKFSLNVEAVRRTLICKLKMQVRTDPSALPQDDRHRRVVSITCHPEAKPKDL